MKKMTETEILQFVREHVEMGTALKLKELSDGNINYVYRVSDHHTSVVVKHSTDQIRTSGNALSTDRCKVEVQALREEGRLAEGLVPEIYAFDEEKCIFIMEDLYEYENLRYALMEEKTYPNLGNDMVRFLTQTLLLSSDYVMDPMDKKEMVKKYINPMPCRISERLVFREPYDETDNTNVLSACNREFLIRECYCDEELRLEVMKLKNSFLTKAQSLLHGDLHTGSIFVKADGTKILDPEFAFYGPAGYDIGNVIANLIFAWTRSIVLHGRSAFTSYIEHTIKAIADGFQSEGKKLLKVKMTDRMARQDAFIQYLLEDMLRDAAGMCGTELIRRIIGDAKVSDITSIGDETAKGKAERICILCGKQLIKQRNHVHCAQDYLDVLHHAWEVER